MTEITEAARRMAVDLVDTEADTLGVDRTGFIASDCGPKFPSMSALARLCTRFIAMQGDMAEIDQLLVPTPFSRLNVSVMNVQAIAAKHRVETDPLVSAIKAANEHLIVGETDFANVLRAELSKRGLMITAPERAAKGES